MKIAIVTSEIDRSRDTEVLRVWNQGMANHETLEMLWPKLCAAFKLVPKGREEKEAA